MALDVRVLVSALATIALPAVAGAQGVISERNVSIQLARDDRRRRHGMRHGGWTIGRGRSTARGQLKVLLRGDGSPPHGAELARRKAYTSRTFRRPSLEWAKRSETDLVGQRSLAEVIPLGGGMPIKVGNEVIGAIGVSGTTGGQQGDEDCAKGAIAKVADQLK